MAVKPLRVFIGYDGKEDENYNICVYSIRKHASVPVVIVPLVQKELRKQNLYTRPNDEKASNEFSITRFLVPFLGRYKGIALFMDCDMIITRDIKEIFDMHEDKYACKVVKHDYVPKESIKMDGRKQEAYPRKNWSSVVLWNCGHEFTKQLTPELVNKATPAFLHRFEYIPSEYIGALPIEMNYLVDEYDILDNLPFNLHYTLGSPQFKGYENCSYSDIWYKYKKEMLTTPKQKKRTALVQEQKLREVIEVAKEKQEMKKAGCGC